MNKLKKAEKYQKLNKLCRKKLSAISELNISIVKGVQLGGRVFKGSITSMRQNTICNSRKLFSVRITEFLVLPVY